MSERPPEVDVVVVGMGWAGGILAAELAKAGLSVVGLERGGDIAAAELADRRGYHDELRFRVRQEWAQDAALETWTLRHDLRETALPLRRLGSFTPAAAVGGSSIVWGGVSHRFTPHAFELRSRTVERYGESAIPEGSTIQDWGIGYEELEPYYDRFEHMAGVSGKAGNLRGERIPGGNVFEGSRAREYPTGPLKSGAAAELFREAALELGLHPYPKPGATLSQAYVNPDGVARVATRYCGFCASHVCQIGAKAEANVTVLPIAHATGNFELRTHANVFRIEHDGRAARGVRYYDAAGREVLQQAGIVVVAAYALNNVRLLLLSGIGEPYDPQAQTGTVGRNYSYQLRVDALGFFPEKRFRRFMGMTTAGYSVDDYNGDNFDHAGLGFIGGGDVGVASSFGMPIGFQPVPPGTPAWGPAWKAAIRRWYDRTLSLTAMGEVLAYRGHFLDLDPTYRDAWGNPLLRITFDWRENERRLTTYLAARLEEIAAAMGADQIVHGKLEPKYDGARYQSTHNNGGAVMGSDPQTSVVNPYLQSWDVDNLFVVGASAFPQNPGYTPTPTVGALAYRAAEAIVERYVKRPGPLAG